MFLALEALFFLAILLHIGYIPHFAVLFFVQVAYESKSFLNFFRFFQKKLLTTCEQYVKLKVQNRKGQTKCKIIFVLAAESVEQELRVAPSVQ